MTDWKFEPEYFEVIEDSADDLTLTPREAASVANAILKRWLDKAPTPKQKRRSVWMHPSNFVRGVPVVAYFQTKPSDANGCWIEFREVRRSEV